MTTQVPPSALLPLNPEQLARLQAATTDLTPTQLAWVSGYFWGVLNQQPAALAATPSASRRNAGYNYYLRLANRQCAPGC